MHSPINNTHIYFTKLRAWSSTGFKLDPLLFLTYTNNLLPAAIAAAVQIFKFQKENTYRID
jgi:hypothetical protein